MRVGHLQNVPTMFWIGGHLWEVGAHESWTQLEVQLYQYFSVNALNKQKSLCFPLLFGPDMVDAIEMIVTEDMKIVTNLLQNTALEDIMSSSTNDFCIYVR